MAPRQLVEGFADFDLKPWEKTSLAQLLHIQAGENPMLKQIVLIKDADRIMEIDKFTDRWMYGAAGGISKNAALVPGLYQLKMGEKSKGWSLIGLEAVALIGAIAYRTDSESFRCLVRFVLETNGDVM